MDKVLIIRNLGFSTESFVKVVSDFPQKFFNIKPAENIWSAAEITEHVIKVERFLNIILKGKTAPTERRKPEDKIDSIKQSFLNFEKKYTAYGPIIPSSDLKDKQKLINKFDKNRANLKNIINSADLGLTCFDFKHGLFGNLTIIEWIYFIIYHAQRHEYQIDNIVLDGLK